MALSQIKIAARSSPLSKAQVEEIILEIKKHHPDINFTKTFVETTGDLDLKTSLKTLGKTDFFTKQVDDLIVNGDCDIAVHSAKDLPEVLNLNLQIIAITKGIDPSDSLVLAEGLTLDTLKKNARIGTSSLNREEEIKKLRSDFVVQDIRGPIHRRLNYLHTGELEGVVIAEAALIRLNLTHLNRIKLSYQTNLMQGKLALVAKKDNHEMQFFMQEMVNF